MLLSELKSIFTSENQIEYTQMLYKSQYDTFETLTWVHTRHFQGIVCIIYIIFFF